MDQTVLRAFVCALLLAGPGCAGSSGPRIDPRPANQLAAEGKLDEAATEYERLIALAPDRADLYVGLARIHFAKADKALLAKEEQTYTAELAKSQDQLLRALELDPGAVSAHTLLGIISAYRGDLKAASQSFRIARRLDPLDPTHTLNLAEINIYRGRVTAARRYLAQSRKLGAPAALVEVNEVLAAWKTGDYIEAKDIFDDVLELNPGIARAVAQQWSGETDVNSFEDLAGACCASVACGPFMARACTEMKQQVAQRQLEEETVRQELELEIERAERMRRVLQARKDLQIEVEDEDEDEGSQSDDDGGRKR